jgi:hypothetical protein
MAKWFTMPDGVGSISVRQFEFHPKVVQDGKCYISVPDHLAAEVEALALRIGTDADGRPIMGRFEEVRRPEGTEDEPDNVPEVSDSTVLNGQILTLQVQMENLRAQIAELTVERDDLRLRVAELEADNNGEESSSPSPPPLRLTGSPADGLLQSLSGMTLGQDTIPEKGKSKS